MPERRLECRVCGKMVANSNNILSRHLRTAHDVDWPDYVVQHQHGGQWPTCACGCGDRLPWRKGGFGRFISGHDNRGQQNSMAKAEIQVTEGWTANPFTGREEFMSSSEEANFLEHCVGHGDPVTKDHGFKVGWEDSTGALRIYTPTFRHLEKRVIFTLDSFSGPDGNRLLTSIKEWCDEHRFIMVALRPEGGGFTVIGGHKPEDVEVDDGSQAEERKAAKGEET